MNINYNSYAVYRFLNESKSTIYVGRSKHIFTRIYKQHFTNKGHLPKKCYDETCLVEIIKLDNNAECKALEDYLIEKYRPKYNKQDKSKSYKIQSFGELEGYLENLEKWKRYRFFRDFNTDSINMNKKSAIASYVFCILLFVSIIYQFILK